MNPENSRQAKTIEISAEAYEKLRSSQESLQKILRKRQVSFDQVIKIFFCVEPLDVILMDMMLEEGLEPKKVLKRDRTINKEQKET